MDDEFQFDEIDQAIVAILKENGRTSHRDIARRLQLTRSTVGNRVAKMTDAGALRIVATADFSAYGYDVLLALAIKVMGRPVADVAADFAQLEEVFAVHIVAGTHHLEVFVAAHDFQELGTDVVSKLSQIRGVADIDLSIMTEIVNFRFDTKTAR